MDAGNFFLLSSRKDAQTTEPLAAHSRSSTQTLLHLVIVLDHVLILAAVADLEPFHSLLNKDSCQ